MKLIPLDAVLAEINQRIKDYKSHKIDDSYHDGLIFALEDLRDDFLDTFEVKEVDLEELRGIARHLMAVKEHIEDMRLDKDEWSMLEKIGYPESFKAQKGEKV